MSSLFSPVSKSRVRDLADARRIPLGLVEIWFQGSGLRGLQAMRECSSGYRDGVGQAFDLPIVLGIP